MLLAALLLFAQNVPATQAVGAPVEDEANIVVRATFGRTTMLFDKGADGRLRIPNGFSKDHFGLADGIGGWDAAKVRVPILVLRSERDHWSRLEDPAAILRAAPGRSELVMLPGAGHFAMLSPPDKGRAVLVATLMRFFG